MRHMNWLLFVPLASLAGTISIPGTWTLPREERDAATLNALPAAVPRKASGMQTTLARASVRTAEGASTTDLKGFPGVRIANNEVVLAYAPATKTSAFAPMAKADATQKWHGSDYWTGSETWARVGKDWVHPGHAVDVARTFIAPADGRVTVSGTVKKRHLDGDGVKAFVRHNSQTLWTAEVKGRDAVGQQHTLTVQVKKGDSLRFLVNRLGSHACDTTGWDPVVAYEGGSVYRASEGFSDKQEANGWRYEFSGGKAARTSLPTVYGVGRDLKLCKDTIDTAAALPFVIISDGNKEDGFFGYVIARDSDAAWTLSCDAKGLKVAGEGAAVVVRYDGTWIEGLKLLPALSGVGIPPQNVLGGFGNIPYPGSPNLGLGAERQTALPKLGSAFRTAYAKAVAGVTHAPEPDLFLLALSEWVQDDNLFGCTDDQRFTACAKEQAERTEQMTGSPSAPTGTGWEGYLRARLAKRAALLADPRLDFGELLFCTRRNPAWNHEVAQYFGWRQRPGGSLYVLEKPGVSLARRDLVSGRLPPGNILEPRLSYNAKKILFSFVETDGALDPRTLPCNETSTNHHYYHLYEIGSDGTGLRQITGDIYDDLMPEWLPDGGIAFVSTRRRATSRCFWWGYSDRWHSYTVFRMNPDGSDIRQLSWNDVNDWFPAVANSGHLLFARWDYIDRDAVTHQNLWSMRPDGTNPMAVWGNETPKPHCTFQAKAIPNSGKIVCVASAHHAITGGPVMLIDPAVHNNSEAAVTRLTPGHYPEAERGPNNEWYNAPWPLAEDLFLVAYSRDPLMYEPARHNPDYALGLYVLDARGNRELLYREGLLGATCPAPLAPRPVPPVLTSVRSPVLAERHLGEVFISDVYEGMPKAERGTIKKIRVVQVFPKTTRDSHTPRIGVAGEENTRAVLGEAPVAADGSAHFLVPSCKPILFQVLDADGCAYRTMRSSTSLMPGERLSCVGCHENKMTVSSAAMNVTDAMRQPAAELRATPESGRPYGFVEHIQPLLDAKCVSCHKDADPKGGIALTRTLRGTYTASYDSLCYTTNAAGKRVRRLSKKTGCPLVPCYAMRNQIQVTPEDSADSARNSGLFLMLKAGHQKVNLTPEELRRIAVWIDLNAVFYGVYKPDEHLALQREGKPVPMPDIQ